MISSFTPVNYELAVSSAQEAKLVAKALLEKRLVASVNCYPVASRYWWQGNLEIKKEYILKMKSVKENFSLIELEIKKISLEERFVLSCSVMAHINHDAKVWLRKNLARYSNIEYGTKKVDTKKSPTIARSNPYRLE